MAETLSMEMSKWLMERRPGLLVLDENVVVEVTHELAVTMGCILSVILARSGALEYERVERHLGGVIYENSVKTAQASVRMSSDSSITTSQ